MKMIVNSPECGSTSSTEVTPSSSSPCLSCPIEPAISYSDCLSICWVFAPAIGCAELSSSSCHFLCLNTWFVPSFRSSPPSMSLVPSVVPLWSTYPLFEWYLMSFFHSGDIVIFFHSDPALYLPSRSWFPFAHGNIVFPSSIASSTPHTLPLNFSNCCWGFEFCWEEANFPPCSGCSCPPGLHCVARGYYWTPSEHLFPPAILCSS